MSWVITGLLAGSCGFGDNGALSGRTRHACGDAYVDHGEGCDDGNTTSGDGCSETCEVEAAHPVCGNGVRETGEACDDGNVTAADGCSATCTVESVCGNATVETGEACDDGNLASGDGCSPSCQVEQATACVLVPQGGCSGATPACDLTDGGDTECRAVTGQGTSNSHCAQDTACRAGYTCIGDGTAATPWCARFCLADGDCLGTGSRCVIGLANTAGMPLNVDTCSNACDPLAQTGCPSGMGCVARGASAGAFTDCGYMGTKADGQVCTATSDCRPGSDCITSGSVKTCRKYCVVGNNSTCPTGQSCAGFIGGITIGTTQFGSCGF
ncbi:MAG: DUF4215 domain-containing protein [Myxococcota bacterium]|nr:DUF4215 domain-containing protein [Myxococcota bacterium]